VIRWVKLFGVVVAPVALMFAGAWFGLRAAGYTIYVDWGDPAPATPTVPPGPPPTASPVPPPPAPATPSPLPSTPIPTATPPALNTGGPPFRLLVEGTPFPLGWPEAQSLVSLGPDGRLVENHAAITAFVQAFARAHSRAAQRAAFRWNAVTHQAAVVVESHPGQAVDESTLSQALSHALTSGQGVDIPVPLTTVVAEWTGDRLPTVGEEVIGEQQIYYADDDAATIQNVEQGALALDGAIALPGAVFSHDAWVYDGRDYAPSYAIIGDRTLLAPGGGLCIGATTLFQTAFWAGLPIVERHNHPYWINMYTMEVDGVTYKGLDATVGDVRFRNTTGAALRVHAWTAGGWLHMQLIGTRPAWEVRVRDYAITNFQPALTTVSYFDEPSLPRGTQQVARNPHDGFDATLTREVVQDGAVIDRYQATSHYQVTEQQIMVGTGD
jgi:vancomycin resistance protein YoaR